MYVLVTFATGIDGLVVGLAAYEELCMGAAMCDGRVSNWPIDVSIAMGSFLLFTLRAGLGAFMELRSHAISLDMILPSLVVASNVFSMVFVGIPRKNFVVHRSTQLL